MKYGFDRLIYPTLSNDVADVIADELNMKNNFPLHSYIISSDEWGTIIDIYPNQENTGVYMFVSLYCYDNILDFRVNTKKSLKEMWSVAYTCKIPAQKFYKVLDEMLACIINELRRKYESF